MAAQTDEQFRLALSSFISRCIVIYGPSIVFSKAQLIHEVDVTHDGKVSRVDHPQEAFEKTLRLFSSFCGALIPSILTHVLSDISSDVSKTGPITPELTSYIEGKIGQYSLNGAAGGTS